MPKKTEAILAINGGIPAVTLTPPHHIWPPAPTEDERRDLMQQRELDIGIKGRVGPIRVFEELFKDFLEHQVQYAITFNSGTSALLAAYFALGIEEGDEVIAPAITYHAAVSCLYFLRANPVLVDVELDTWTIDPAKIEAAISPRTKAIIVVHQWGHPADMDRILAIAKKHRLKVIEDCSHAHGSRYKGRLVGTFGEVAVFSLQTNKLIFAGEGGILVTNSMEVHDRATLLGHYRDRSKNEVISKFYQQFWVTGYGLKLRMSPYNAITAIHSLAAAHTRIAMRKACLEYFSEKLRVFPELTILQPRTEVELGAWYGFKPRYDSSKFHSISRQKYIDALVAEGVDVSEPGSPAFSSLPLFTLKDDQMFRNRDTKKVYQPGDFPQAERLARESLSLPTFSRWPDDKKAMNQYVAAFQKLHDNWQELA